MDNNEQQEVQPEEMDIEVTEQNDTSEKDWKAEALKYKAMAYKYRLRATEGQKQEPKAPATVTEPSNIDDKVWEVADMIQKGYTRSDAEFIHKNGGSEALKDPNSYVSVALRVLQEQRRAEQASQGTEASTAGLSEIERKYTPEQLKNMSVAELEKILPRAEAV